MKKAKGWVLAGACVALLSAGAAGEEVTWSAQKVGGSSKAPLGSGKKVYSPEKDVIVQEGKGRGGQTQWTKSLLLDDTFALSANIYREPQVTGFGLVLYRRGDDSGFSWEWFEREREGVFVKLQGPGRLAVTMKKGPGYEEIQSIEFLEDIVLRYLDDMSKPPGTHTHEVTIHKGSVLKVAR